MMSTLYSYLGSCLGYGKRDPPSTHWERVYPPPPPLPALCIAISGRVLYTRRGFPHLIRSREYPPSGHKYALCCKLFGLSLFTVLQYTSIASWTFPADCGSSGGFRIKGKLSATCISLERQNSSEGDDKQDFLCASCCSCSHLPGNSWPVRTTTYNVNFKHQYGHSVKLDSLTRWINARGLY